MVSSESGNPKATHLPGLMQADYTAQQWCLYYSKYILGVLVVDANRSTTLLSRRVVLVN